jgi:tetratricopeptide (TPR) repeat protein
MAACAAAGAVAGVLTTQAVKEKDKQAVKRYEKVNEELINSRDKLQQRYYELADRSQKQIKDLNLKLAESEMEKDLVYLALSLYHELMALREDIDINPCFEVLVEFHKAIILTNYVLQQLDKSLVPVTQDYFSRTLTRIDERDNLSKEQLFNFMAVLMNPQQDTVTSLLGEVQNGMLSQPNIQVEEENDSLNQTITIEPDNEEFQESQDKKSSQTQPKISSEQPAVKSIFLEEIEKAIAINPDNGDYWAKKSLYLSNLKKHEESLESIEEAILIDRKNDKYWYLKSLVLFDLHKHEAALKCAERAISL